ncbi:MAG: PIN domain-containing protein [Bryobacteraceae bacterium]
MKRRMNDKPFFDTNVLVYAFREHDRRSEIAQRLLARGGVVGVQVLNEFVAVMRRKLGMSWKDIGEALSAIRTCCPSPAALNIETHETALRIAERYRYHIYDALVIAAGLGESCTILYSEDMQDGQTIGGLTIQNPFLLIPN